MGQGNTRQSALHDSDDGKTPSDLLKCIDRAGRDLLEKEYNKLKNIPVGGTFTASKLEWNQDKNRYPNVMCLDQTRVKIHQNNSDTPSNNTSDYIHANYIDGFKSKRQYIATQAPMENTIGDFWKMVWQEKVLVIVMTTRMEEQGMTNCEKYWPDESTTLQYNNIAITHCYQEQPLDSITTTTLLLQHLNTCEMREVKHIHFSGWPVYGVPDDTDDFLYLQRYVRQMKKLQWAKFQYEKYRLNKLLNADTVFKGLKAEADLTPLLAHCNAGIGRTGTFLAVDILIDMLHERGKINVYETIRRIREQRPYSIQNLKQYTFVNHAILKYAEQHRLM